MKRPLKKLSPSKQRELDRYVEIIEESFAKATATKRADRLKDGRILKIILYGSYARGDWVHDPDWPHETKFQKRCFELLRAAYVKARYSRHYRITAEELTYLMERIEVLETIVREASEARLNTLRKAPEG